MSGSSTFISATPKVKLDGFLVDIDAARCNWRLDHTVVGKRGKKPRLLDPHSNVGVDLVHAHALRLYDDWDERQGEQ